MSNKNGMRIQTDHTLSLNRFRAVCARCYQAIVRRLAAVKAQVTEEFSHEMGGYPQVLSAAINEAEAVAWQTPYPHLFFPALAEEKAVAARRWAHQQRTIRQRGNAEAVELQLAA